MTAKPPDQLPVLLVIEDDIRVLEALKAEVEDCFQLIFYSKPAEAMKALQRDELPNQIFAAVVQMASNTKDELSFYTDFFNDLPDVPIFLTLNYNCDYQVQEPHIRNWTEHIYFRPFEIDKLVQSLKALQKATE